VSVDEAAQHYVALHQELAHLDDIHSQLRVGQAYDDLVAVFAPGMPDDHLLVGVECYLRAWLACQQSRSKSTGLVA
jgi:hypothetical protein